MNISRVPGENRERAWICTQHLRRSPEMSWTQQLTALVDHSWNGGFNRSSEHHEGASWYKCSEGVHPELHPIERWEAATTNSEAFGVSVPWKEAELPVGEIIERIFTEQRSGAYAVMRRCLPKLKSAGIVTRFINFA
ncbi:MAG: hypothetical protein IH899_14880, partial [Planctomycetes bacterium]|nr:hypothetical protein [Planctomycetota bacterium]